MRKFTLCMALAAGFLAATFQGASAQSKSTNTVFSAGIMPAGIADAATTALQKKANALPSTEIQFKWVNGTWDYLANNTYTYNGKGWQTEMLGIDTTRGTLTVRVLDSFDAQFNRLHHLEYSNHGSGTLTLDSGIRNSYTYDAQNRVTESIMETYKPKASKWENDLKTVLTYTGGSRFTSEYTQLKYNSSTSQWVPVARYTNIVWTDTTGTPYFQNLSEVNFSASTFQVYDNGTWKDNSRTSIRTSSDSTIITNDTMGASGWNPATRQITVMVASGEKSVVYQSADATGAWEDKFHITYFSDQNGNDTLINYDLPDGSGGWGNIAIERTLLTYNASGNITEKIVQFGSMFSGPVTNTTRSVYSYGTIAAIAGDDRMLNELSIFPNPAKEKVMIRLEKASQPVSLQLTDLQGRTLMQHQAQPMDLNLEVSLPQLPQGVYLLQLTQGNEVRRTRLVIGN